MPLIRRKPDETTKEFVARFMANPQMRKEFPDEEQRVAVARKQADRLAKRQVIQDVLKKVGECLCVKQDVPEVERVIAFMTPLINSRWNDSLTEAVRDVLRFLQSFEDNDLNDDVDFLASRSSRERRQFLESFEQRVYEILLGASQRLSAEAEAVAEDSVDDLLFVAAVAAGGSLATQPGSIDPVLRTAAVEDLRTMLSGRVQVREQTLKGLTRQWLTDPNIRQPLLAAPGIAAALTVGSQPSTRAQWDVALRRSLGLTDPRWIQAVTDVWAYRWFSIGAYRSLRRAEGSVIVAQATIDERTTNFCRWVDGKILNTPRIDRQIERHIALAMEGDAKGLQENWPLLPSTAVNQPISASTFGRIFSNLGLPPYHWRCRTVPKRRQL